MTTQQTKAESLNSQEKRMLQAGTRVRIVTPGGETHQGEITSTRGLRATDADAIEVNGRSFATYKHDIVPVDDARVIDPPRFNPSADAILAIFGVAPDRDRPNALDLPSIVERLIGFDPSYMVVRRRGRETCFNQFVAMAVLKRELESLVKTGELVMVSKSNQKDRETVRVTMNRGWVLGSDYRAAEQRASDKQAEAQLAKLGEQARAIVAGRHRDEVEQVLADLIAGRDEEVTE